MEQFILWFNIIAFTLLFASLGVTSIVWSRARPRWLRSYLIYLATYAFFTIFNTYGFFSRVYLPQMPPFVSALLLLITFVVALVLLMVVPWFIRTLVPPERAARQRVVAVVIAAAFLVMMALSIAKPEWKLDTPGSFLLNGYLGVVTLRGLLHLRGSGLAGSGSAGSSSAESRPGGPVIPFLYLSGVFYLIVAFQSLVLPLTAPPLLAGQIEVLTAGLICLLWGGLTMSSAIFTGIPDPPPVAITPTEAFFTRFAITPREAEIVTLLLEGKNNKEIATALFISPRTIEAHVYNIYRKCAVRNRIELARKVASF